MDRHARSVAHAASWPAVPDLGLEIRAGLHTGDVELADGHLRGIAVAHRRPRRVARESTEILVRGTVKDLIAGSGIELVDRGTHACKGIPGDWHLIRGL